MRAGAGPPRGPAAVFHRGTRALVAPGTAWQAGRSEIIGVRPVVDPDGYRPNVGIVLMHGDGRLFWARRVNRDG